MRETEDDVFLIILEVTFEPETPIYLVLRLPSVVSGQSEFREVASYF